MADLTAPVLPSGGTTNSANASTASATSSTPSYAPSDSATSNTGSNPLSDNNFSNLSINGQSPDGTDTLNVGNNSYTTPIYQGRTIAPIRDVASNLGAQVNYDPMTGNITVNGNTITPSTIQNGQSFAPIHDIVQAAGLPSSSVQWDPTSKTVSVYAQPNQTQGQQEVTPTMQQGNGQGQFNVSYVQPYQVPNVLSQVTSQLGGFPQAPTIQPYQAPDVSWYWNNLMPMQKSFTPDWTQYYNQAHQQFDPTTQADVNQLYTKQASDVAANDQKMNQRGLYNSGIAQAAENDIRAKSSDAIAKVVATSQSNIAKVAQQLYTDAFDQYYKGNTMAIQNNQLMLNQAMNAEKQAYTEWLGKQNLSLTQYKDALDAWNMAATQGLKQAQMQMTNQQAYDKMNQTSAFDNATNALKQYQFNNLSADQSANLAQKQYQFSNLSADQAAQLAQKQYMFNNLSADQAAQVAQKQYQFNNLSADQQATLNQNQQKINEAATHDRQLEQIDWAKVSQSQQQLNETINNNVTKAKEFAANMKNSQLKEQVDALTKQMQDSNSNVKNLNDQKSKIMDNIAQTQDANTKQFYQSQLNDINNQIATEMANLQNAQSGINQRLQLDSATTEANQNLGFNAGQGGGDYNNYWKTSKAASSEPQAYSQAANAISQAVQDKGVPTSWIQPLLEIAGRESDWNPTDQNSSSSAYGLFQFLNGTWTNGKTSDPYQQALQAIDYIKQRYGDPVSALQFWDQNQWY